MNRRRGTSSPPLHVVIGCSGPVGIELMRRLHRDGLQVRGVCRSGKARAPEGVQIVAGDIGDPQQAPRLTEHADVVYCCVGVDYTRWLELWPPIIDGLLAGAAGKRLVFADNLYSYGPVDGPMTEDLPLTGYGVKPALRARITEMLLGAHAEDRLRVALVRASDFYGPGVRNAVLGERVFPAALEGQPAQVLGDVDQPHSFTFVPDFARALASVGADDEAFGEIWHVPNAPTLTTRETVERAYRLAGTEPRLQAMPKLMLDLLAIFNPLLRELKEMGFLWDRPYVVDHSKFAARFWDNATPLDEGLQATLDWYRQEG